MKKVVEELALSVKAVVQRLGLCGEGRAYQAKSEMEESSFCLVIIPIFRSETFFAVSDSALLTKFRTKIVHSHRKSEYLENIGLVAIPFRHNKIRIDFVGLDEISCRLLSSTMNGYSITPRK